MTCTRYATLRPHTLLNGPNLNSIFSLPPHFALLCSAPRSYNSCVTYVLMLIGWLKRLSRFLRYCLYRSATGENWHVIMKACTSDADCQLTDKKCGSPFAYLYFISFIFFCSFLVSSVFWLYTFWLLPILFRESDHLLPNWLTIIYRSRRWLIMWLVHKVKAFDKVIYGWLFHL